MDDDILAALAELDAGGVSAPAPVRGSSNDDMVSALAELDAEPGPQSGGKKLATGLLTAANSASFGFGEEFGSHANALIDEGLELLGFQAPASYKDRYESYRDNSRQALDQFREENPGTALALDVAGGLTTGGIGAAKTGLLKGASTVGRVVKGAATGAATGAVAGVGYADGDMRDRVIGGMQGFGIGALFGGTIGGVSGAVSKLGKTETARKVRDSFKRLGTDELGAIGKLGSRKGQDITRAQKSLLKMFEGATDDELLTAAKRMEAAEKSGVPMTIFEALDVPQGYVDAKAIRLSRGGRDTAERFMQDRRKGLSTRIGALLDDVSPERSIYKGQQGLASAGDEIVEGLEKGRRTITKPLYDQAIKEAPIVESKKIDQLMEVPQVQDALKTARRNYFRELGGLPDNHFRVLDAVKKELDDQADSLMSVGNKRPRAADAVRALARDLRTEVDAVTPTYERARSLHGGLSKTIDWLKGTKYGGTRTAGLIEDIMGSNNKNASTAVTKLLKKQPEELAEIAKVFKTAGKEQEMLAGFRAGLQDKLERVNTGVLDDKGGAIVDRVFGVNNTKEQLTKLIGKDGVESLFQKVDLEGLVAKGEKQIGVDMASTGSMTTPIAKALGEQKGLLGRILTQNPITSMREVFESLRPSEQEQLTKEIAEELFTTASPKKFNALLKVQQEYNNYVRSLDTAVSAAQGGATQTSVNVAAESGSESGRVAPGAAAATAAVAGGGAAWKSYLTDEPTAEGSSNEKLGAMSPVTSARPGFLGSAKQAPAGLLPASPSGKKKESGMTKTDVSTIEAEIDSDPLDAAIYEVESNRDPSAKNPKSSAAGGFQLIRSMQKSLGVEDPYDLAQNFAGYKKLKEENMARFGDDPRTLYAAHYLGAPLLSKYLSGKKLSAREQKLVAGLENKALPRFDRIYARIAKETANV